MQMVNYCSGSSSRALLFTDFNLDSPYGYYTIFLVGYSMDGYCYIYDAIFFCFVLCSDGFEKKSLVERTTILTLRSFS